MLMDCDLLDKSSNTTELPLAAEHCQNISCMSEELNPRRYILMHAPPCSDHLHQRAGYAYKSKGQSYCLMTSPHHGLRTTISA